MKRISLLIAMAVICLPIVTQARSMAYVQFEGPSQGLFKGSTYVFPGEDFSEVSTFSHEVFLPVNPDTGQPVGAPQHRAIKMRLASEDALAQLFQALTTSERLNVYIVFISVTEEGNEEIEVEYFLENATVASVEYVSPDLAATAGASTRVSYYDDRYIEVELMYRSVEVVNLTNSTSWQADPYASQSVSKAAARFR